MSSLPDTNYDTMPDGVELFDPSDNASLRGRIFNDVQSALVGKFPFSYGGVRMELEGLDYKDPEEQGTDKQKTALMSNRFLHRRLRGTVKLIDENTGDELDRKELTLMRVPYLSDRGTMIHNGSEYTVLSQARLRPGIYSRRKQSDDIETQFNVKHGTGRAFRLRFEPHTSLYKMDIGTSTKVSLYSLLHNLGYSDEVMRKSWGDEIFELNRKAYDPKAFGKAYKQIVGKRGKATDFEGQREELINAFNNSLVEEDVVRRNLPSFKLQQKEAKKQEYDFGCLMFEIPQSIKEDILKWGQANIDTKKLAADGLEISPHITVVYGFSKDVDPKNLIPEIEAVGSSFKCKLGKISKFANDDDVIKISVESDDLRALHHRLKKKFSITSSFPVYKPHITVAYVKSGSHDQLLQSDFFKDTEFEFDEFVYSPVGDGDYKHIVTHDGSNKFHIKKGSND